MKTQRYSSTLPLTLVLDGGGEVTPCPGHFTTGKKTRTHCTGGWMGLGTSLDRYRKSCSHQGWNLVLSCLC